MGVHNPPPERGENNMVDTLLFQEAREEDLAVLVGIVHSTRYNQASSGNVKYTEKMRGPDWFYPWSLL